MKKTFLTTIICILGATQINAQHHSRDTSSTSQIFIETDPTVYFFNGYSLAIRRSSTFIENLNLGIGIYRTVLPEFYIESVEENIGKGWEVRNFGVDGFIEYHVFNPNKGLTIGLTMSFYKFTLGRNEKEEAYNTLVETIRVGYLWRPIKKIESLYIYPWVGLSTGQIISGTNKIDGETFNTPTWSFVPAFQIGYSF